LERLTAKTDTALNEPEEAQEKETAR